MRTRWRATCGAAVIVGAIGAALAGGRASAQVRLSCGPATRGEENATHTACVCRPGFRQEHYQGALRCRPAPAPVARRPAQPQRRAEPRPARVVAVAPREAPGGCPAGMVLVPAGEFGMGRPHGQSGVVNEFPQRRVRLSAFCIDRTEVTARAYGACVAAGACAPAGATVQWPGVTDADRAFWGPFCNAGRSDREEHPVNCVGWSQADAYCRWRGGALPTEAQWEYAARGSDGRSFPWGDGAPDATRMNGCGAECVEMAARNGRRWAPGMHRGNDGWVATAPVGSFPRGASPFGALDMAGNVWEWVADWYGDYREEAGTLVDPQGPAAGASHVLRDRGWEETAAGGAQALRRYPAELDTDRRATVGFRCARRAP